VLSITEVKGVLAVTLAIVVNGVGDLPQPSHVLVLAATMTYNIQIQARYIPGPVNKLADLISRSQITQFHLEAPWADPFPTPVPPLLLPLQYLKLEFRMRLHCRKLISSWRLFFDSMF
jgi:hypothetical protein